MTFHDQDSDQRLYERDNQVSEAPKTGCLKNVDNPLDGARRWALYPLGDEEFAYPS